MPYHSPHKFKHGFAVYALSNAKDIATLKAISQNLIHANLSVTDGVYGILSDTDVKKNIAMLGKIQAVTNEDELYDVLEMLLAQRKKNIG